MNLSDNLICQRTRDSLISAESCSLFSSLFSIIVAGYIPAFYHILLQSLFFVIFYPLFDFYADKSYLKDYCM